MADETSDHRRGAGNTVGPSHQPRRRCWRASPRRPRQQFPARYRGEFLLPSCGRFCCRWNPPANPTRSRSGRTFRPVLGVQIPGDDLLKISSPPWPPGRA